MVAEARPAAAGDAILGVAPRLCFSPTSVDGCGEVMALTARQKLRVGFIGGATELALGRPPEGLDAVVRSDAMRRVLEYAPADMVLVAEAGVTLAQVQAVTREHGQMLALDAPHPERATLGGLVASGAFGPRRARYGTVRDLIIGVTLVRGDGAVAHGGGKVVKNVAGFDLPKICCGSLGTLGMIATAGFRLHPFPESSATALFGGLDVAGVVALIAGARQAQLEPTSAVALRSGGARFDLGVRFEGFDKGVRQQLQRLLELGLGRGGDALGEAEAAVFWERHDALRGGGALRVKLATLPSRLAAVEELAAPILGAMSGGSLAWYATLGFGFLSGAVADVAEATAALCRARDALVAAGGWLILEDAPAEIRASVDPWGPAPNSFAIMAGLKQRFDPQRRLNLGRFVGGL